MRPALAAVLFLALATPAAQAQAISTAQAIAQDPPADAAHPARMEVIHVPTGGVKVNGIVYVAAGPGPHPTFVLFHGLPGNERNLDLAQAVRRAGWNVVAINYRGSWGSPGAFSFAQNLEDARAVLARSLGSFLCRELTTLSYPEIARALSRPNHSTVITADKRVRQQLNSTADLSSEAGPAFAGVSLRELSTRLSRTIVSRAAK